MGPQNRRALLLIYGMVFIMHAVPCFMFAGDDRRYVEPDTSSYVSPALALLQNGAFLAAPGEWDKPETFRTPGYPLWLAIIFSIFGRNFPLVVLGQICLFLGTLHLTTLLTEKLFGGKTVLPAVLLLSLDPASFIYTLKILSETLATFFTMLCAYALVSYFQDKDRKYLPVIGFSLTAATYVRPTTYYFPLILVALFSAYHLRQKTGWKTALSGILLMLLPFILLIGAWQARNHLKAGTFMFSTGQGRALLFGKIAQITSIKEGASAAKSLELFMSGRHPEWQTLSDKEQDEWLRREAIKLMRANPWLTFKTQGIQLFNFFLEPGTTSALFRLFDPDYSTEKFNWFAKSAYFTKMVQDNLLFVASFILGMAYLVFVYSFLAYGLYRMTSLTSMREAGKSATSETKFNDATCWSHLTLLILIAYIANICALGSGYSRFRVVVMPLLCTYSAGGISLALAWLRERSNRT